MVTEVTALGFTCPICNFVFCLTALLVKFPSPSPESFPQGRTLLGSRRLEAEMGSNNLADFRRSWVGWSSWKQLFLWINFPKPRFSSPFVQDNDKIHFDSFLWILAKLRQTSGDTTISILILTKVREKIAVGNDQFSSASSRCYQ